MGQRSYPKQLFRTSIYSSICVSTLELSRGKAELATLLALIFPLAGDGTKSYQKPSRSDQNGGPEGAQDSTRPDTGQENTLDSIKIIAKILPNVIKKCSICNGNSTRSHQHIVKMEGGGCPGTTFGGPRLWMDTRRSQ